MTIYSKIGALKF